MKKLLGLLLSFSFLLSAGRDCRNQKCNPAVFPGAGSTLQGQTVDPTTGLPITTNESIMVQLTAMYNAGKSNCSPTFTYNADIPGTSTPFAQGSGAGITQTSNGTVFFGGTDNNPTPAQVAAGCLLTFPVAVAGIAIIFRLDGLVLKTVAGVPQPINFTRAVLAKIYNGTYTTWGDVASDVSTPFLGTTGLDTTLSIFPVVRGDSSGSTFDFTTFLSADLADWPTPNPAPVGNGPFCINGGPAVPGCLATANMWSFAVADTPNRFIVGVGTNNVLAGVNGKNGAIGYVGYNNYVAANAAGAVPNVLVANVDDIAPNPTSFALALPSTLTPEQCDFNFNTLNNALSSSHACYPIASPTNLVVRCCQQTNCQVIELRKFLAFVATSGQTVAVADGFGALNQAYIDQYLANLANLRSSESCVNYNVTCCDTTSPLPPACSFQPND